MTVTLSPRTAGSGDLLRTIGVLILVLVSGRSIAAEEVSYRLENGLRVTLVSAGEFAALGGNRVAVVILFDIGEIHDPPGRSGLGHLIEHLYVTAAAGATPARSASEWFAAHDGLANAQTGRHYTVIAGVVPSQHLETELDDAAARLSEVRVEPEDLERELPRIELELAQMYGGAPRLAAANLGRAAIDPLPAGSRKGGVLEQIRTISAEEIRTRLQEHYTPSRARLIVAGAFPVDAVRQSIDRRFGGIPSRPAPPLIERARPEPSPGPIESGTERAAAERVVGRVWAAPDHTDDDFATHLVFAARFQQIAMAHGVFPLFTPIDDPGIFGGSIGLGRDDDAAGALARLDRAFAATLGTSTPMPAAWASRLLDRLLSLSPPSPLRVARDPYGVAFGIGRRQQLGLDREKFSRRIAAITDDELETYVRTRLTADRSATVAIGVPLDLDTPTSEPEAPPEGNEP